MSTETAKIRVVPESGAVHGSRSSDIGEQHYLTAQVESLAVLTEAGKWAGKRAFTGKKTDAVIFAESRSHAGAILELIRNAQDITIVNLHLTNRRNSRGRMTKIVSGDALA